MANKRVKPLRIGNIEFRWGGCNECYEVVRWYPNPYYGHKDEYEDCGGGSYHKKDGPANCYISETCFEHPESCLVLAFFDVRHEGENVDLRFVGSRPLALCEDEFDAVMKCVRYGYKKLSIYPDYDSI